MSIYPVKLSKWYPVGDEMHDIAYYIVQAYRCYGCDKKLRWKSAFGHHSLPWGHGKIWCSERCCDSGRVAKPDYRRNRRFKRKFGDFMSISIPIL